MQALRLVRRRRDARLDVPSGAGLDRRLVGSLAGVAGSPHARAHGRRAADRAEPAGGPGRWPSRTSCCFARRGPRRQWGSIVMLRKSSRRPRQQQKVAEKKYDADGTGAGREGEGAARSSCRRTSSAPRSAVRSLHQAVVRELAERRVGTTTRRAAAKFRAAAGSRGSRRAPAARGRAPRAPPSGRAAASRSARRRAATTRRCRGHAARGACARRWPRRSPPVSCPRSWTLDVRDAKDEVAGRPASGGLGVAGSGDAVVVTMGDWPSDACRAQRAVARRWRRPGSRVGVSAAARAPGRVRARRL